MRSIGVVAACLGLAACYRPALESACETRCTRDQPECPSGETCGGDLRCHGAAEPDCSDATVPEVADAAICFGTGLPMFGAICNPASVPATLTLSSPFSTDSTVCASHPQGDTTDTCVLIAQDITIDSALVVTGGRPLVLIATHDLIVTATGSIDVGSRTAANRIGPGAGAAACVPHPGSPGGSGSGGGAGGAFRGFGGRGGNGDALGGLATGSLPQPQLVRAGCAGSDGGATTTHASGGRGGGAIYLVAGAHLGVMGWIGAGGAGASISQAHQGGGGGGSGGLVALEAPAVTIAGTIYANSGGGGGGGGDTPTLAAGDADLSTIQTGAPFANSTGAGGSSAGGAGGCGTSIVGVCSHDGGNEIGSGAGGGGGAGGEGYILILSSAIDTNSATISPTAITIAP